MANPTRRVGVILFQLGGPDTLEAIEPFLFNLFCDPDIIDFPFARIGRKPLAKLISTTRAKKVQHHYSVIGGGSPIRRFTEQQAARCSKARGNTASMPTASSPCATGILLRPRRSNNCAARIVTKSSCLPLYPQYSSTTTGSSLNEWRRLFREDIPVQTVETFYRHPFIWKRWSRRWTRRWPGFRNPAARDRIQRSQRSCIGHRKGRSVSAAD